MKKQFGILIAGVMLIAGLAGCSSATSDNAGSNTSSSQTPNVENTQKEETADSNFDTSEFITVVSREEGSGTRGAFVELFGVEQKNEAGEKIDYTTEEALITNSTSVMMTTVNGNEYAIGYISLGSLNETVKALNIDGVEASADKIKSGDYKIARPFNIATKAETNAQTQDFIKFIMSDEGQAIIEENGYISNGSEGAFTGEEVEGKIVIAGSSSVTPVMEKLKEAYNAVNPKVTIEIQQSDSTTGMTSVIDGICDIGMASREVKDSELEKGIVPKVIAMDGIAVIVNKNNPVNELSSDGVKEIFVGEATSWEDVIK